MPKIINSRYDLNKSWSDDQGNFYSQSTAGTLKLWARMSQDAPEDLGPLELSPTYDGSPLINWDHLGSMGYYAATFNDGANTNAQVTDTSGRLCFTSLANHGLPGTGTDRPFSISCWVKMTPSSQTTYFFGKQGPSAGTNNEYRALVQSNGAVQFRLEDETASNATEYIHMNSSDDYLTVGVWSHLVFTYDGRGGASANAGMRMYKDAATVSLYLGGTGTYVGMQPDYDNPLYIGAEQDGTSELDGQMAEFAVWSSELSAEEVAAIYNVTRQKGMGGEAISGILNNPARILLRDQDNATGSYPTVARTGDPDFMGRSRSYFDDRTAVDFFSSYATAEIRFDALPRWANNVYPPDSISLTGTLYASSSRVPGGALDPDALPYGGYPTNKAVFEFLGSQNLLGVIKQTPGADPGDPPTGNVKSFPVVIDPGTDPVGLEDADEAGKLKARLRGCARRLAAAVNFSSIGIKAYAEDRTVFLRQQVPTLGTYALGNLVQTSSKSDAPDLLGVTISQFAQHGPSEYLFPMVLPTDSTHILDNVATPNITGTLSSSAIMSPGVSDLGLKFDYPGEDLSPFDETRILIDPNSDFFKVGTPESLLPGFSARLADKTSFAVNLTPSDTTHIYFSTGTQPNASGYSGGVNSGMAYYNFSLSRWEVIGDLSTGSNVDYMHGNPEIMTASYLSVIPPHGVVPWPKPATPAAYGDVISKGVHVFGLPNKFAGFPLANKFDATGSQLLDMSQYISAPFLLEKVVLEISGAFGLPPTTKELPAGSKASSPGGPWIDGTNAGSYTVDRILNPVPNPMTFMLLNQFQTPLNGTVENETTLINYNGEPDRLYVSSSYFPVEKHKDIIWFGRFGTVYIPTASVSGDRYKPAGFEDLSVFKKEYTNHFLAADTWETVRNVLPGSDGGGYPDEGAGSSYFTGAIRIEASPRAAGICTFGAVPTFTRPYKGQYYSYDPRLSHVRFFGNSIGGRNLFDMSSGRSFVSSVIGSKKIGDQDYGIDICPMDPAGASCASADAVDWLVPLYERTVKDSPYVLMPTDKLILAAVNQIQPWSPSYPAAQQFPFRPYSYWREGCGGTSRAIATGSSNTDADGNTHPPMYGGINPGMLSVTFSPGAYAKITFYGTEVRDQQPVSFTLNQPLTSDAIHEDVRDDMSPYGEARCLDQFDTDPVTSFRGGYLDNIVTGSMVSGDPHSPSSPNNILTNFVDQYAANVRAVQTSVVDGGAGVTGSLQRFVRVTDASEVYYDSTVPNIEQICQSLGITIGRWSIGNYVYLSGRPIDAGAIGATVASPGYVWAKSAAFELIGELARQTSIASIVTNPSSGVTIDTIQYFTSGTSPETQDGGLAPGISTMILDSYDDVQQTGLELGGPASMIKQFFGIGDFWGFPLDASGIPTATAGSPDNIISFPQSALLLRGFKYGLINAVPTSPNAVFRYDTYGQFRDMLEQRPYTKFFVDNNLEESAVGITFVERLFVNGEFTGGRPIAPADTNSQNLSVFATSSVPYYDTIQGEREGGAYPWGRDRATPPPDISGIDTYSYDTG